MIKSFKLTNSVGKSLKRLNINQNPDIQKSGYVNLIQFI